MTFTPQGEVELDERGLPKVVHPFPSLISPFGKEIIEEETYHGGQPPDKRNKSPLKLNVNIPSKYRLSKGFIQPML